MAVRRPSVEGPDFAVLVRQAEEKVRMLENSNWDFASVPEIFARDSAADVVAKEVVHIFDGKRMSRFGGLVMGGVGSHFNLMGPIPPNSELRVTSSDILHRVNHQLGSKGLEDVEEYRALGDIQEVEFYNYQMFYTLRDLMFWLLLHDAGSFPSSLEIVVRHMAAGNIVQNDMYAPARPPAKGKSATLMSAGALSVSFPSTVVEWMDKPIYGGFAKETIHMESLLTFDRSDVSHPYLPLIDEGKVRLGHHEYHVRRFSGVTPKDGVRGPGIPAENASDKY
jgi:hypothetical protein